MTRTYNFFIIAKLEVVLHDLIFIFLDFVMIEFAFLDFRKVPSNNILPSRGHDGVLLLTFPLVEPVKCRSEWKIRVRTKIYRAYRAGVKEILFPI